MSHQVISTILRYDSKQTSFKIALLRALNDVVLAYPDVSGEDGAVAVPLRMLAAAWVAYYCPFVAPHRAHAGRAQARWLPERAAEAVSRHAGARPDDVCLVVAADLWGAFRDVSLWVEALCIHEWSQFTERVSDGTTRGVAYALLTERPDNRLSCEWERNQVDLLMLEGARFECPWTGGPLARGAFDLDHIVPLAVYPFHELWNLVPSNVAFNRNRKRARLPGDAAMVEATPRLVRTYATYASSRAMAEALRDDFAVRFSRSDATPSLVAESVRSLVASIGAARNVARF